LLLTGAGNDQNNIPLNAISHPRPRLCVLFRPLLTLAAGAALFLTAAHVYAQAPQYNVTVLDGLGGTQTVAEGINASGQVVGWTSDTNTNQYAVAWNGSATPTVLGSLGSTNHNIAVGINASGQIAGQAPPINGPTENVVVWNVNTPGTATALNLQGIEGRPYSINDLGQVAGFLFNGPGLGAVWNLNTPGTETTLTPLNGDIGSFAFAINDSGKIAGVSSDNNGNENAVVWNVNAPGSPTALGFLGEPGVPLSQPDAINASGQVAGSSYIAGSDGYYHAVVWNGTTPTDLGTLGGTTSNANAINDSGEVVGSAMTSAGSYDPFLYTDGEMYDFNNLLAPGSGVTNIVFSENPGTINDSGQIAANGEYDGQQVALLLTPTPEPGSAGLLAAGGALLLGCRRRRIT